jgi:hypothetical protein
MAAQCGGNAPTTPSQFLSGVWTGALQDSILGPATALLTITQVGDSLAGTWSVEATSFAGADGGSLSGTVSGSNVRIFLTSDAPPTCFFAVTATANGNTITGTFTMVNCAGSLTGSVSLTRTTSVFADGQ